ncbi:unnamed protein product [Chilo suppressalis]|uniref:ATPase inhibitor mai-2, mitochondrial n=1 Tax=Chilo suppressalis TaxID=168631 RepID=A0ABN8AWV4_CHISP|nr:unnamed protein product [Chilo suppressalis]
MATMRFQQAFTKLGVRKVGFSLSQGNYQIGNGNQTSSSQGSGVHTVLRRDYTLPPVGTGAGRGGGAGGSVRESGGALGQYGAAQEEEYFFNKRKEQLAKLKSKMKQEGKSPDIKRKEDK